MLNFEHTIFRLSLVVSEGLVHNIHPPPLLASYQRTSLRAYSDIVSVKRSIYYKVASSHSVYGRAASASAACSGSSRHGATKKPHLILDRWRHRAALAFVAAVNVAVSTEEAELRPGDATPRRNTSAALLADRIVTFISTDVSVLHSCRHRHLESGCTPVCDLLWQSNSCMGCSQHKTTVER